MFKWARPNKTGGSYEPKTPKMPSISLPDERYTPLSHHHQYSEKPRSSFLRRFTTQDTRRSHSTAQTYDSWQPSYAAPPSGRSRVRTVSTPVREVEAPRPIRPHPSQGPFIPVTEQLDRIRIDPSRGALAPVGVPSAAYLEDQIRQQRPASTMFGPPSTKNISAEERKLPKGSIITPSKAWLHEQEEQAKLHAYEKSGSVPPLKKSHSKAWADEDEDLKNWKAVPVVDGPLGGPKNVSGPLKSALKKTSSIKPPVQKPILKAREYGDSKAYYSENETDKRRSDWIKPIKVITTPSKAYLEEQQERMEAMNMQQQQQQQRGWTPFHQHSHSAPRPAPVHELPASAFQHTHSGSTGSPTDSILAQEYHRSRRPSYGEGNRPKPSNYMPAYIRDSHVTPTIEAGPHIEWPLVEYGRRRHRPEPLIYFDAGFNPRYPKFEVLANRGGQMSPLSSEERNLLVSNNTLYPKLVITNKSLEQWPVIVHATGRIRVIDVFRAIYDTYAVPLTKEELAWIGPEYIQRCERAFFQRCKDAHESTHFLERQGMTRIDLLKGRRIFKGLVYHRGTPLHHFELLFDEGPYAKR